LNATLLEAQRAVRRVAQSHRAEFLSVVVDELPRDVEQLRDLVDGQKLGDAARCVSLPLMT
jgi:hypothetical protein